jgi:hypothetical protein
MTSGGPFDFAFRVFREAPSPSVGQRAPALYAPDVDFEPAESTEGWASCAADGQTVIIGYADAKGAKSTRRITIWGMLMRGDVIIVRAKCHERRANRNFRVDRIEFVADLDGVLKPSVEDYFQEIIGADLAMPAPSTTTERVRAAVPFKATVRRALKSAGVPLLVAIAKADKEYHWLEMNEIHDYANETCASAGITLSLTQIEWMHEYISSLRPTKHVIETTLGDLVDAGPSAVSNFAIVARSLIDADAKLPRGEAENFLEVIVKLFEMAAAQR